MDYMWLHQLKMALMPSCCLLCDALCRSPYPAGLNLAMAKNRVVTDLLCTGCRSDLVLNKTACVACAEPMVQPDVAGSVYPELYCPRCQQQPPAYSRIIAPYLYHYPLDALIQSFKQQDQLILALLLAGLLSDALWLSHEPSPDLILPVPTHWRTRFSRGFNPAAVLADLLGREFDIPVDMTLLRKVVYTPSQHTLNRQQRRHNLQHSFRLQGANKLQGRRVALVDDVVTTGSTAGVIAQLLRDNGADSVQVWALARTPPKRMQQGSDL